MIRRLWVGDADRMLSTILARKTREIAMKSIGDSIFSGWEGHSSCTAICEGCSVQDEKTEVQS